MRNRRRNTIQSVLIAAGLFAAVFLASATPADAKSHGKRHGHVKSHSEVVVHGHGHGHGHVVGPRRFVVPRHVAFRTARTYDPYFHGRVFFASHRHYHAVYRFPVYTSYGVVYQPYSYCGNDLYEGYGYGPSGHVSFAGPHFGVSFGF